MVVGFRCDHECTYLHQITVLWEPCGASDIVYSVVRKVDYRLPVKSLSTRVWILGIR